MSEVIKEEFAVKSEAVCDFDSISAPFLKTCLTTAGSQAPASPLSFFSDYEDGPDLKRMKLEMLEPQSEELFIKDKLLCDDSDFSHEGFSEEYSNKPGERLGKNSFKCNQCDYRSAWKNCLRRHVRTHAGVKPFSCHLCDFRCSQKGYLRIHIQKHTKEKPFKCKASGLGFLIKGNVRMHEATHTGKKTYKCSFCGYQCSMRSHLEVHLTQHNGVKPFKCNVYGYEPSDKINLRQHMKKHRRSPISARCRFKCGNHLQR